MQKASTKLLLKGLQDRWVRDRASKQVDKWTTMDEVFSSIMIYADQSNKTRVYAKLEYEGESIIWVSEVNQRQGFPLVSTKRAIIYLEGRVPKNKMTASIYASREINNRWTDNNRARLTCMITAKTTKRWKV